MAVICYIELKFFVKEHLVSVHELKHDIFLNFYIFGKKIHKKHFIRKTYLNGFLKITVFAALLEFFKIILT
jgi:hypothetical protein